MPLIPVGLRPTSRLQKLLLRSAGVVAILIIITSIISSFSAKPEEKKEQAHAAKPLSRGQEAAKKAAIENIPKYWYLNTHPYKISGCEVMDSAEQFSRLGEPIQVVLMLEYQNGAGDKMTRLMGFTASADGQKITYRYSDESDGLTPAERAKRGALEFVRGLLPNGFETLVCTATVHDPEWHAGGAPISVVTVIRYNGPDGWTKKLVAFEADATGRNVVLTSDLSQP